MSMATRCTACGTVFRVVPDQLRVSKGWVRCGRCAEVFNAVAQMVDVPPSMHFDLGTAPLVQVQVQVQAPPSALPAPAPGDAGAAPGSATLVLEPAQRLSIASATAAESAADIAGTTGSAARLEPQAGPGLETTAGPGRPTPPTFIRQAERAARWQQPKVRVALSLGLLAGVLGLMLQLGIEYRDLVAARWPDSRPWLEHVCRLGNCRIEPPRLIEALAVDSSGLTRVEGTSMYRFSIVLRNRAAMALAMPAIDLSLTDTQGRVIARRTLAADELGAASGTISAATELPLQATLGIGDRPVSGYTIEIFYP